MKLINALLVLVILVASSSMCLPDHAPTLRTRVPPPAAPPSNERSDNDLEAVKGLLQFATKPIPTTTAPRNVLHLLPINVLIHHVLPNLLFKEAINLKDYGISESDIIHYCSKANAEDIINYIFRDAGNIDSDEARVENLIILLSFKEVQKQLEADNAAVLRNIQRNHPFPDEDLSMGIMPHRVLDSLQAAVDAIGQHGNLALLRNVLENRLLSMVNIPYEAAFIAAERRDVDMVDWILKRAEIDMHRFNIHIPGGRLYDTYINYALNGSISGEQFGVFQRVLNRPDPRGYINKIFQSKLVRDLMNKNLRSWMDYVISDSRFNLQHELSLMVKYYVKRSNLKDGNPMKPTLENLLYLMHLPIRNRRYALSIREYVSIMVGADFDIIEHLARLLFDPSVQIEAHEFVMVGGKKRSVSKLVSGLEACNQALNHLTQFTSNRYKRVRDALEKVKAEFEPLQYSGVLHEPEAEAEFMDFLKGLNWNA
jgi:hypothetical protein